MSAHCLSNRGRPQPRPRGPLLEVVANPPDMSYDRPMRSIIPLLLTPVLLALLGAGCAGGSARSHAPDPARSIRITDTYPPEGDGGPPAAGPWLEGLTLAVPGPVRPERAPLPDTDSERVVFAHLYETLATIDGAGVVRPALAGRWVSRGGGRVWDLDLRPDGRFWDGTPVTAAALAAAWRAMAFRLDRTPHAPTPLAFLPTGAPGLQVTGERSLRITLPEPVPDLPAVLAHPALAVRGPAPEGSAWPVGSGPCRPMARSGSLVLEPNPLHPAAPSWASLTVLSGGEDADVTVTRDKAVGERLAARRRMLAGPWNRLHFLVCPPERLGTASDERLRWTTGWSSRELSLDNPVTLSGEAGDWSFQEPEGRICPLDLQPVPSWPWPDFAWPGRTTARDQDLILFPEDDPLAAFLAAELAGLAARALRPLDASPVWNPLQPPRAPRGNLVPQALGLAGPVFEAALQAGRAGAYVLPVDNVWGSACRQLAAVTGRAVWLQDEARSPDYAANPLPQGARPADPMFGADVPAAEQSALRLQNGRILMPLVASRLVVGMRRDLGGLAWRHDGLPDLTGLGRTSGPGEDPSP